MTIVLLARLVTLLITLRFLASKQTSPSPPRMRGHYCFCLDGVLALVAAWRSRHVDVVVVNCKVAVLTIRFLCQLLPQS